MLQRFRLLAILVCILLTIVANVIAQEEGPSQSPSQQQIPPESQKQLTPEQIQKIQQQQEGDGEAKPTEAEAEEAKETEEEKISAEEVEEVATEEEAKEKKEAEEETEAKEELKQPTEPILKRFGDDFFKPARDRILNIEKQGGSLASAGMKDAITGFVGPVDMANANVQVTIPQDYMIRPGDKLTVIYWSRETTEPKTINFTVDTEGQVIVPH